MGRYLKDASLSTTRALPNGAGNVTSGAIDLGAESSQAARREGAELLLEAPALTAAELPNGATMTYQLVESDNADLSSPTIGSTLAVQTGAGGAGAAATEGRKGIASGMKRFVGLKATNSGAGNASGKTATLIVAM